MGCSATEHTPLVDLAANKTASVRTWAAALLNYQARFVTEPKTGVPIPPVRITFPDGITVTSDQADANERLSAKFGRSLTVAKNAAAGLLIEFAAGTLGGAYATLTEAPLAGGAPPGTFFDYGTVHIVASSTLELLQRAYPQGRFDVRRFRPNFVVQVDSDTFLETALAGRTLRMGRPSRTAGEHTVPPLCQHDSAAVRPAARYRHPPSHRPTQPPGSWRVRPAALRRCIRRCGQDGRCPAWRRRSVELKS